MELVWMMDAVAGPGYALYLPGALVLTLVYRRAEDPSYGGNCSGCATASSAASCLSPSVVAPYTLGRCQRLDKLSVLTLALMPLTLAYAIVRYRLMDVDIIFRRGYALHSGHLVRVRDSTASFSAWPAWCREFQGPGQTA